jgi:hypothetical protein
MLERAALSNVMFRFIEEDGVVGSCPRKRLDPITPTTVLFLPAVITTVAQQQIFNNVTLPDELYSVLRSNPSTENGVFGSKGKCCILTDWLMCTVYLCSGFKVVFSPD